MIDYVNNTDLPSHLSAMAVLSCSLHQFGRSEGNCVWDLSAVSNNGNTVSIEVKDRSFPHDKYGDVFAEEAKQTYTRQNYNFDKSLAVNVFSDGYIAIADLYDKRAKHFKRRCPKQTWSGGDHSLVIKDCLSLPQTLLFKLCEDGKFRKVKRI